MHKQHKTGTQTMSDRSDLFCAFLWPLIFLSVVLQVASLVASPIQTPPGSATSKSLHTFATLHPSAGSSPARSKPFDRSEPKHCPTNTADSLPAIAGDNLPSKLKAPRPSRAGCCKPLRCNNEACGL